MQRLSPAIVRASLRLLVIVSSVTIAYAAPADTNSTTPGPFPVGVTTSVFVDYSRIDAVTKEPRTLVTDIWYPAADDSRSLPRGRFSDFIPGGVSPLLGGILKSAYKLSIEEIDRRFLNASARDARVRDGRFPVVFFSHGNRGLRFQNTFWCDFLASHGYVILSADHTGNAALTVIKGKVVLYQGNEREHSAQDRPKDLSFLLDQMTIWNQGADSRFAKKLDLTSPTAAGMSFGSYTAIKAADLDARFRGVIAMAFAPPEGHTNLAVPSLLMLGDEDATIGAQGNAAIRANFAAHKGPAFLLEMKRGGHYSFTDMGQLDPNFGDGIGTGKRRDTGEAVTFTPMESAYEMVNSYSLAFLDHYIKGNRDSLAYLRKNQWPAEMNWKVSGIEPSQSAGQ
ncbi:MAG: hypothetical protein ABI882_09045 [Acidobacteriota bacterium]